MDKKILSGIIAVLVCCMMNAQERSLSKSEVEQQTAEAINKWESTTKAATRKNVDNSCINQGNLRMKYTVKVFGDKPADGRSMWISMHGGGNAPTALNDGQWENQKVLYQPAEGLYICPRAPWDDWDMWFKNPIDNMFEELIRTMVTHYDVNPNKVYLMGYSAGGDGVWRMAPRMADHWAAASMMAGHPGDVDMRSLRNLPFMIWCGGDDAAYDRNKLDAERGRMLDSLQLADPDGFIHSTHILPGKPHWMDLEDKAALPWMAKYQRNPYPTYIEWVQGDNGRQFFYWLGIPQKEAAKGKFVSARIKGNTITIGQCDYSTVTVFLNDSLVNLDKKVLVKHNGKTLFYGKLKRLKSNLLSSLQQRGDPSYCFPAKVTVSLSNK